MEEKTVSPVLGDRGAEIDVSAQIVSLRRSVENVIHGKTDVVDLALGHLKALEKLASNPGVVTYNLGTGRGYSVLEVVASFEKASGHKIPYRIVGRRPGDMAVSYTDPAKANRELGWSATRGIDEMCADGWRWQSANPDGYQPDPTTG